MIYLKEKIRKIIKKIKEEKKDRLVEINDCDPIDFLKRLSIIENNQLRIELNNKTIYKIPIDQIWFIDLDYMNNLLINYWSD